MLHKTQKKALNKILQMTTRQNCSPYQNHRSKWQTRLVKRYEDRSINPLHKLSSMARATIGLSYILHLKCGKAIGLSQVERRECRRRVTLSWYKSPRRGKATSAPTLLLFTELPGFTHTSAQANLIPMKRALRRKPVYWNICQETTHLWEVRRWNNATTPISRFPAIGR